MRAPAYRLSLGVVLVAWIAGSTSIARGADREPGDAGSEPSEELLAPVLKAHVEAPYPAEALRERLEGRVGLELVVDEAGTVVDAKITGPAGHGFDAAALEAARHFTFE